jgi:general stress protein 26
VGGHAFRGAPVGGDSIAGHWRSKGLLVYNVGALTTPNAGAHLMAATFTDTQALQLVSDLIDDQFFGILTTVDAHGRPHARWMGAATIDGLHSLFTLTTCGSRKCQHLQTNPQVCWLFSTPEHGDVITLLGKARVNDTPGMTQHVWDRLVPCARRYAMDVLGQQGEPMYCVIDTWVQQVELLSPRLGIVTPRMFDLTKDGRSSPQASSAFNQAAQPRAVSAVRQDDFDQGDT